MEILQLLTIMMSAVVTAGSTLIAVIVWFNKKMARLEKLERAVFDQDGKERYVSKEHCALQNDEIITQMNKVEKALLLINKAQMRYIHPLIDMLPDGDQKNRLIEVRNELSDERKLL